MKRLAPFSPPGCSQAVALFACAGLAAAAAGPGTKLRIDADTPAGNIVVEGVDGDAVRLRPDLRDTAGNWFYWCFRARGAEGRALTFRFAGSDVLGARGPALSLDGGWTWRWLGRETVRSNAFTFVFPTSATDAVFSVGMPYTERNLRRFLDAHAARDDLKVETLTRTPKGRAVEMIRVGSPGRAPEARVLITARHHACEMLASYALEGLLRTVLDDDATGRWLREHVEFLFVPFVDKDGVEDGDQGKNRRPRDHNRDYSGESVHTSTRALREYVPAWSGGKLRIMLDLHCPYLKGATDDYVYMPGKEDPALWERQRRLAGLIETNRTGPIPVRAADNLPFGTAWNTAKNGAQGWSSAQWAQSVPGVWLATTIEIPYANARGAEVNAETARALGRDLAAGLFLALRTMPGM